MLQDHISASSSPVPRIARAIYGHVLSMLFASNFLANVLENESCSKRRELIQNTTFLSTGLNVSVRRRRGVHPSRDAT